MGVRRVVFGLGSNLGDRRRHLIAATARLGEQPGVEVVRASQMYETAPVGGPPQGDYLNNAVLARSSLAANELVARALAVEAILGRTREPGVRDAPRTIDIDVLWIEGETFDEGGIVVPHPRLAVRAFAVRPLVDVVPDAVEPTSGARYADLPAAHETLRLAELT
jgi:2-amino-4-hydroxy-6-hydroxymethyldihydropteridine diphosphokinase